MPVSSRRREYVLLHPIDSDYGSGGVVCLVICSGSMVGISCYVFDSGLSHGVKFGIICVIRLKLLAGYRYTGRIPIPIEPEHYGHIDLTTLSFSLHISTSQLTSISPQLGTFSRGKAKVEDMQRVIAEARRTGAH